MSASTSALAAAPTDVAVERLKGLLSYVEQVIKLDERPTFRLSEYRLPTGQIFVFHQHDFHALPGVKHDLTDDEGPIWLSSERLRRTDPPEPPEVVTPWLELSPDPERAPSLRDSLIRTVPQAEKTRLLASGEVRPEDCAEVIEPGASGRFDIRLRLEDRPEIKDAADNYISSLWLPWAEVERPRRKSIALYQKLFEVAQLAELGGVEQPLELVWGMGLTRWKTEGVDIDLPLLERLVEIEILEEAAGEIRIRPRSARASANLRAFEEVKIQGVALALDAARRAIDATDADGGVTPFLRDTFEPALRAYQARLDSGGTYLPDQEKLDPAVPIPAAGPHLTVSDRWVIFARRRSDNFLLSDIANLRKSIDKTVAEGELPSPARTLVVGPGKHGPDGWQPLGTEIGETIRVEDAPRSVDAPLGDLFFPKPFNDDQIEIVRRLENADGVVVQGPPGTGKTHTISNIICHYLATGRRVLVVSHGEPALAVLRNQLPNEVRDLAISITVTEREGFKQLETAVRVLQSIVEGLRPGQQGRVIEELEQSIVAMRQRVAAVDTEIERFAQNQLAPVPGSGAKPAELAKSIAASREQFAWFIDRPHRFSCDLDVTDSDVDALKEARKALGDRIKQIHSILPSVHDLPDGAKLAQLHADIIRANEFEEIANQDKSLSIRIASSDALRHADMAAEAIDALVYARTLFNEHRWLDSLAEKVIEDQNRPILVTVQSFVEDAASILEEHDRYLQRPVDAPDTFVHSAEIVTVVRRLAEGEAVFGLFAFREKALRPAIESLRVMGRLPASAPEWAHVHGYLCWREQLHTIDVRWQALAAELGAPDADVCSPRALSQLIDRLQIALVQVPDALRLLEDSLPHVAHGVERVGILWLNPVRLANVGDNLRSASAGKRLSAARLEVKRLASLFSDASGDLGQLACDFLNEVIGRPGVESERVERIWDVLRGRIDDLAQHRSHFEIVRTVGQCIEAAGSPEWSRRLVTEPADERADPLVPPDWRAAWDWAAADAYLRRIDQRGRLRSLSEERRRLDESIKKAFERLVRERTFYTLAGSMTGPVRAALMMFATALRRIGRGTGRGAERHRREARNAMARCYDAIPCWIMPSWRVAEQLPGELGSFDLVVIDEASQSDIREVTALLRGKKVLVVGDDKQVSPTAAFIENTKIDRLERSFLKDQPFKTLLLPGASLYDLAKVMFPDKFVMLREHFRCVEPIIRFSMQFYPEPLLPLRVPTTQERIDPPLVDIYVQDGHRTRDKTNRREAETIVDEIRRVVSDPALARVSVLDRWRTIGVISLIGAKQAAMINRMLLDELGEEIMLRHHIACGDSATLQGNERDIVFLSMVADPAIKQAQTAAHFEQRYNVALSRARDQMVLVRSVREEDLKPYDLKAKVIQHFREPMVGAALPPSDSLAACDSDFEREVLSRLLARGYRVRPQVGALGFRIDLVVEGDGDRRLAIECDGDKYHGPERWAEDMRRQRVLERVGWRFWRCWASSFAIDPDGCMSDLFATLEHMAIQPLGQALPSTVYTQYRTAVRKAPHGDTPSANGIVSTSDGEGDGTLQQIGKIVASPDGICAGDRVVVRYLDDNKTATYTLSRERDDQLNGVLAVTSPLGKELLGLVEEDEAEFEVSGRTRRVLVVRTERRAGH